MRGDDVGGEKLEAGRPLIDVAHRAVGDESACAEPDVNRRLHLAPEGTGAGVVFVEILDHHDRRFWSRVDISVVVVLQGALLGGCCAERLRGPDHGRARIADDRLQGGKAAEQ